MNILNYILTWEIEIKTDELERYLLDLPDWPINTVKIFEKSYNNKLESSIFII